MDTATVGLVGAVLGAAGALSTVFLTHRFTQKREEQKYEREREQENDRWLRDQRQTCYHNAVKYLIRVRAIGAYVKNTKTVKLPEDAPLSWYDDISEANAWLTSLHYYCGDDYHDDIGEVSTEFLNLSNWLIGFRPTGTISKKQFLHILSSDGKLDYQEFVDLMLQIENVISNCARQEFKLGPRPEFSSLQNEI
ncbi:hypothetical protein RG903_01005 [Thermithiobacillus tepidarius DSM 3134]|uniref:hypothetical protein n=1 Tax=Thermithiobacillus tepidarius TaxID=929 RepID=UPI0012DFB429|nr:hypothetical protein [Thermithiobacillus tepidarius]